jgi:hypothetical protein
MLAEHSETPVVDNTECRDLPFPPHPDPAVPGSVVQHAIHPIPQPGELPGSDRKGIDAMNPADVLHSIGTAGMEGC